MPVIVAIDNTVEKTPDPPPHPLVRRPSLEPREDDDDFELHPNYDLSEMFDAMLAAPYKPEHKLVLQWRDLGDDLIERGEDDLRAALEAALAVLNARIAADRERRRAAASAPKHKRRRR